MERQERTHYLDLFSNETCESTFWQTIRHVAYRGAEMLWIYMTLSWNEFIFCFGQNRQPFISAMLSLSAYDIDGMILCAWHKVDSTCRPGRGRRIVSGNLLAIMCQLRHSRCCSWSICASTFHLDILKPQGQHRSTLDSSSGQHGWQITRFSPTCEPSVPRAEGQLENPELCG